VSSALSRWLLASGLLASGSLASGCGAQEDSTPAKAEPALDEHAASKARLAAFEVEQRATIDFEHRPASDHRFGSDPVRLIALPEGRFAGLLRGRDRLLVLDAYGATLAEIATPHLPTGVALTEDGASVVVVGIGEPTLQIVDMTIVEAEPAATIELRERARLTLGDQAMSPRDLAFAAGQLWIVDEGTSSIHALAWPPLEPATITTRPHCRGPIELRALGERLLTNCVIDHRLRIDELEPGSSRPSERAQIGHDGPIWAFDVQAEPEGDLRLALAGVEDHPLDRRDGGFGYIDSFVFLARYDAATHEVAREAEFNVSELGLITPKSIAFGRDSGSGPSWTLDLTGYASGERLRLRGRGAELAKVERYPWLPGSQSVLRIDHPDATSDWIAANPLLDIWMLGPGDLSPGWAAAPDDRDDRDFDERLGEALVYTSAMAPDNSSEGLRSRFTCETCHFEGRGDGRTHWTGRGEVHATSKTLLGLFENRPYFSRALDKTLAVMVDNEFHVANRHSPRDAWAPLTERDLAWLTMLPGWPGEVDGEQLRRALMAFLIRWTPLGNPRARLRSAEPTFTPDEARGAALFRDRCERCHEARLLADDPASRVAFERWPALVLSDAGPIVWASDVYAATAIEPWVHELGARVPSLRRLHLDGPYFTNGAAPSVAAVLSGVRIRAEGRVDHDLPDASGQPLAPEDQRALGLFLALL